MSSRSSSVTSSGLLPRQRASARATASALHPQGACVITASYSERENLDKTLPNPLTKGAESNILLSLCGHGGTGRRVRLRGVWLTPSEFKSRWPHQKRTPGKTGGFSFPISEAEGHGPGTYAAYFRPDCAVDCRNSYTLCRCLCARCQMPHGMPHGGDVRRSPQFRSDIKKPTAGKGGLFCLFSPGSRAYGNAALPVTDET